jgi:hypothetical protein
MSVFWIVWNELIEWRLGTVLEVLESDCITNTHYVGSLKPIFFMPYMEQVVMPKSPYAGRDCPE